MNEVVAHDDLMAAARRWADQILECGPLSVRASKEVAYQSYDIASLKESMTRPYP